MLDKAKAEVDRVGATQPQWICADARDLAERVVEKADFVLIANTFHGVPDKTGLIGAAATVLKPGGRLAIVNWHRLAREKTVVLDQARGPASEMRMSPEQVREVVEPAGFELSRIVQLPPYHYGAIFRTAGTGT
jgi:SAM-dependent methyltransferase